MLLLLIGCCIIVGRSSRLIVASSLGRMPSSDSSLVFLSSFDGHSIVFVACVASLSYLIVVPLFDCCVASKFLVRLGVKRL